MPTSGYFDYNATTPVCSEAVEALHTVLDDFGNPSSRHCLAKRPKESIALARADVARLVGANAGEITFTSGGTEANNWALKGALIPTAHGRDPAARPHVIVSEIEHASILEVARFLERAFGFEISRVRPNSEGIVPVEAIAASLRPNTRLVSVMLVNNEVGSVQPTREIAKLLHGRGIHFHADGVQAVGKMPVDAHELGVDTLSFAAHKFYGPKGIGGLYIRDGVSIEPLLHGGGQECGLRGGTESVALIAAMGAASAVCHRTMPETLARLRECRATLQRLLAERVPGVCFNGPEDPRLQAPNTLSIRLTGVRAEAVAAVLDHVHGVQVSLGSACSNNKQVALSHVLVAMGLSEPAIQSTLRISMGIYTQQADLLRFADALASGVRAINQISNKVRHDEKDTA